MATNAFIATFFAKSAKKVAKNPYVQQFAQTAAVAAATYYGVPPEITNAASGMLFSAMNGDDISMDKIKNIAEMAADEYAPAQKMKDVLSMLYKGGMSKMKPYLEQAQAAATTSLQQVAEAKAKAVAALPPSFQIPGKPAGMFPFTLPGFELPPLYHRKSRTQRRGCYSVP